MCTTSVILHCSHSLRDNTNGAKWLFIRAPPRLSREKIWVIKFPFGESRLNCESRCSLRGCVCFYQAAQAAGDKTHTF